MSADVQLSEVSSCGLPLGYAAHPHRAEAFPGESAPDWFLDGCIVGPACEQCSGLVLTGPPGNRQENQVRQPLSLQGQVDQKLV